MFASCEEAFFAVVVNCFFKSSLVVVPPQISRSDDSFCKVATEFQVTLYAECRHNSKDLLLLHDIKIENTVTNMMNVFRSCCSEVFLIQQGGVSTVKFELERKHNNVYYNEE